MSLNRGIRLPFQKSPAIDVPTAELTDIAQVVLPYTYGTDDVPVTTVSLYDTVRRGTPLCAAEGRAMAVLSSVTGAVSGEREVEHPLYGTLRCAVIDRLPVQPEPEVPVPNADVFTAEEVREMAERAHIIDELDGVPLAQKLRTFSESGCAYLVADAVQVEPFESSAWAVLRERAEQVVRGLALAAQAAGTNKYHIAVCLSGRRYRSLALRVRRRHLYQTDSYYPAEHLVRRSRQSERYTVAHDATVGRVGVQACLALYRAMYLHEPHTHVTLTVAGDAVVAPQNVTVPFGTSVRDVLAHCGLTEDPAHLILGEVMTGIAAGTQDIPVLPGMTCVLAFTEKALRHMAPRTCIGCGRCAEVCHANLLPFEIARRYTNMHYERLATLSASSCDRCGACSYICPSGIDLVNLVDEARCADSSLFVDLEEDADA